MLFDGVFVGAFEVVASGVAVEAAGSTEFGGGDLTLMSGVGQILLGDRDRLIVRNTTLRELVEGLQTFIDRFVQRRPRHVAADLNATA